jgi:hypothetical protein
VALSAGLLLLILIFGLHNRGDAFARQWLAITPWHVLEFPCIQVTAFGGNMDIEWRKPKLIAQGPLPLFHFNNYYRPAPMDGTLGKMLADCMAMRTWCERNLPDKRAPVGLKSTVMCDYYAQKRFSYALRRDVLTNISSSVYICDATTALRNGEQLCIRGTLFNLVRSEAQ